MNNTDSRREVGFKFSWLAWFHGIQVFLAVLGTARFHSDRMSSRMISRHRMISRLPSFPGILGIARFQCIVRFQCTQDFPGMQRVSLSPEP